MDFQKTLQSYLLNENVKIINTTFEGSLICVESKDLFLKWLVVWKPNEPKLQEITDKMKRVKNSYLLIEYLRIIFNGKSETLIKRKKDKLTVTSPKNVKVQNILNYINNNYKVLLESEKTNGWVTSFLDFAINEIENKIDKIPLLKTTNEKINAFNQEFKKNFPELYGILLLLRHDS